MKTIKIIALSVITLGLLSATTAHAGWSVGVTIGGPVYVPAPRPVYPPPPVCYPPRPVCPPVVIAPPPPVRHGRWYNPAPRYWHKQCDCRLCRHGRHGRH